jgi:hypothetical protein
VLSSYGSSAFNLYSPTSLGFFPLLLVLSGILLRRLALLARAVAVQVDPCESKGLKPGFHTFIGFKGWVTTRRFRAIGHTGFDLYAAPPCRLSLLHLCYPAGKRRYNTSSDSDTLKPADHISKVQGLKPGAFKLWISQLTAPRHGGQLAAVKHGVAVQVEFESKL